MRTIFLALGLATGLLSAADVSASKPRPNVIVLLADDVGYGDLGCHGSPVGKTPNLDRLSKESVRFTDFHVQPMCSPTRGALLTGRHCLDNGAWLVAVGRYMPRPELPTMADVFRANGYATGMFGKWHLGENYPFRPMDRGFDEAIYYPGSSLGTSRDFWNNNGFDGTYLHNGKRQKYPGYVQDVWMRESMAWMAKQKDAGRPFFCYLPSNLIHGPEFVEEELKARFAHVANKDAQRAFTALERYDGTVGDLERFLESSGLRDNTIMVFMSDNGGNTMMTDIFNAGMRGHKQELYEGGHRVPCFIRWPQKGWGGGRDVPQLAVIEDLLPTFMDACGLKPVPGLKPDGTDLAPVLDGKTLPSLDERISIVQYGLFREQPRPPGAMNENNPVQPNYGESAILWRNWRLVFLKELYDLSTDPAQKTNVISAHPEIAEKLRAHYKAWWEKLRPDRQPMPEVVIGTAHENPTLLDWTQWEGAWVDWSNPLRVGVKANGTWHLRVAEAGDYLFTLRRWPEEVNQPIRAAVPAGPWPYMAGVAMPIAKVRLEVQGQKAEAAVGPDDVKIELPLKLDAGPVQLKTWFLDDKGEPLSGAYYVDVERITAKQ